MKKLLLPALIYPSVFIGLELLLFQLMQGVAGGDIIIGALSMVILFIATILSGLLTFKWETREKFGIIIGLLLSYSAYGVIISVWL